MSTRRVLFTAVTLALLSASAVAQDTKPAPLPTPVPGATAPMTTPKHSTTGTATAPLASKINLNTATAVELAKLPKVSPASSKAIMEARAKAKFKNWDDFVARKVVPADSAAAIKDVVSF
jgi:competence protein ComEA